MRYARIWHASWSFFLVSVFLLLTAGGCWAISLYDVIQLSKKGYSDSRIIELIKITNSRFQLDADSVITLKQAGVSEKVIKAVIEASEPRKCDETPSTQQELEKEPAESASSHQHKGEHTEAEENPEPLLRSPSPPPETVEQPPSAPSEKPFSPSGSFGFFPFEEVGAGHGGSHQH